jgi:hypothetical protein
MEEILVNSLMVHPFWDAITLKIFRNGRRISWIPTCKLSIPLWVPLCPMLCTAELIRLDFKYLCVPMTWCRVEHLFASNMFVVLSKYFYFFICGRHVDSSIFCFTTRVKFYFQKLLKTQQISYTLMKSCCIEEVVPDQTAWLGSGVLCKRAMWHD